MNQSETCKKYVCYTNPNYTKSYPSRRITRSSKPAFQSVKATDKEHSGISGNMILLLIVVFLAIICYCQWANIAKALNLPNDNENGITETSEISEAETEEYDNTDDTDYYYEAETYEDTNYDDACDDTGCSCNCGCPCCG